MTRSLIDSPVIAERLAGKLFFLPVEEWAAEYTGRCAVRAFSRVSGYGAVTPTSDQPGERERPAIGFIVRLGRHRACHVIAC